MKNLTLTLVSILLVVFFIGCETLESPTAVNEKANASSVDNNPKGSNNQINSIEPEHGPFGPIAYGDYNEDGYKSQDFNLWAGQDNLAGIVTISNDDSNIYVYFDTDESADLSAVHVYVYSSEDDVPDSRPAPGQTPYKADNLNDDSYMISIPFAALNMEPNCDDVYYVVAHAALITDDDSDDDEDVDSDLNNEGETAYSGGDDDELPEVGGGGGSWFYAVIYTIICGNNEKDPEDPIEGIVFYDLDRDGVQDPGEPGIPGVMVYLSNGDSVATDENGYYNFPNLDPGDYTVSVGEHNDREHTTPASVDVTTSYEEITVVNFGFEPYFIEGVVFYDVDGDGVQDLGEPGIEGVEVTLNDDTVVVTDENGYYSFEGLLPGDYNVTVGEHNDRDATTATSVDLTIVDDDAVVNFGFEPYHIDGVVFYDLDGDGVQDPGEPGIEGVEVTLDGDIVVVTDENGYYIFEGVLPGDHNVTVGEHNGRDATTPTSVDVTVTDDDLTIDFGFEPYHIEGVVFLDVNGNGVQDADEPGLEGVEVTLDDNTVVVTDENGYYVFEGLLPGDYSVAVEDIEGFAASTSTMVDVTIVDDDVIVDFGFELDFNFINGKVADGFTIGFWKNNVKKALDGKNRGVQVSAETLAEYLDEISEFALDPFSFGFLSEAYAVLNARGSDAMTLLSKQLLGSEFNYMNDAYIDGNELVTWAFLYYGEYMIVHADDYSRNEILELKDWYDAYNNSHGEVFYGPGN